MDRFMDKEVQPQWREAWALKELAKHSRFSRNMERRKEHARELALLPRGQRVLFQNQH